MLKEVLALMGSREFEFEFSGMKTKVHPKSMANSPPGAKGKLAPT